MPCKPIDLNVGPGPNLPVIPGFGIPSIFPSLNVPALPTGFPADLVQLVQSFLSFLTPAGQIQPSASINYTKDAFDAIISVLDKFLPFLMAYKLLLPILNLLMCIVEICCAIPNPFSMISKIKRLFRVCLPAVLALFPFLFLILLLISLLLLLLKIIQYIIAYIENFINLLLANIEALIKAFSYADSVGVLEITRKLGLLTCDLQNLFLLLTFFSAIIGIIKAILQVATSIPPCSDSGSTSIDNANCCAPPVCPAFIKNNDDVTGSTGDLLYLREVPPVISGLPSGFPLSFFTITPIRGETWQFYDPDATIQNAIWNITSPYDFPPGTNNAPFFPSDANLSATTPPSQAPYTINLTLFYNPTIFDRVDPLGARYIQINNCIVLDAPTQNLAIYNNTTVPISTGVVEIAGGLAYENDGVTPININGIQGTLNTFIHLPPDPPYSSPPNDGYTFSNLQYTFNINHEVLLGKSLITLGCIPEVGVDREFVNTVFGGNAGYNSTALANIISTFPDTDAAQACLTTALAGLISNVSTEGVATFQATTTACLNVLQDATNAALSSLLNLGYDQYTSVFTVIPTPQFTSQDIAVQVTLNESNGQNIATNLPADIGAQLASQITGTATFGTLSTFTYDGYNYFDATITSTVAGSGTLEIAFNGLPISTVSISTSDVTIPPSITVTALSYSFIYSPTVQAAPRFDTSDVSPGGSGNGNS